MASIQQNLRSNPSYGMLNQLLVTKAIQSNGDITEEPEVVLSQLGKKQVRLTISSAMRAGNELVVEHVFLSFEEIERAFKHLGYECPHQYSVDARRLGLVALRKFYDLTKSEPTSPNFLATIAFKIREFVASVWHWITKTDSLFLECLKIKDNKLSYKSKLSCCFFTQEELENIRLPTMPSRTMFDKLQAVYCFLGNSVADMQPGLSNSNDNKLYYNLSCFDDFTQYEASQFVRT
jgi:hypothetical protein